MRRVNIVVNILLMLSRISGFSVASRHVYNPKLSVIMNDKVSKL